MLLFGEILLLDTYGRIYMRQRRVGISRHPRMTTSPLYDISAPVPYSNSSQPASTGIDADRRLFIVLNARCASRLVSGILLRKGWIVYRFFILVPVGFMMILLSS